MLLSVNTYPCKVLVDALRPLDHTSKLLVLFPDLEISSQRETEGQVKYNADYKILIFN